MNDKRIISQVFKGHSMYTFTNTSTLTRKTQLDVIPLEDNLHVFRMSTQTKRTETNGTLKVQPEETKAQVVEGFIDDKNLKKLKAGQAWKKLDHLTLFMEEGREIVRTVDYMINDRYKDHKTYTNAIVREPFEAFAKGDAVLDDIVIFQYDSHMLLDRKGVPLPVAIDFDYISNGRISNTNYNLKKLVEHLLTRDDVIVHKAGKGYKNYIFDTNTPATSFEEAQCIIPYYNADKGRTHTVYFRWMPKREDYLKMWEWCKVNGGKSPSTVKTQAVFELDLLGLRAAGASLCNDFWGSTYEEEDEDEL